jgi:hypothetical protein
MKAKILGLEQAWRSQYPDIPMVRQAIDAHCPEDAHPSAFRLLVSAASPTLSIRPFGPGRQYLDESAYCLSLEEATGAIRVDIEDDTVQVTGLTVQNTQAPETSTQWVCMHNARAEPDNWVVFHNSIERRNQLLESIGNMLTHSSTDQLLLNFIQTMLHGEYAKALNLVENNAALQQHKASLNLLAEKFERELNAHGMKRTFRYWSLDEKSAYLQAAAELTDLLEKKFQNTALGFGAVLGFQRDADLIGHDDDIDILVALAHPETPNLPKALDKVAIYLDHHGHKIEGVFFSHLWVRTPQGHRMDVFVGLIEADGQMSFYPSARRSLRKQDVFPAEHFAFMGSTLPFPACREDYLCKTYGSGWRSPDAQFAHPWDRSAYQDLDAPRRQPAILTRGELKRMQVGTKARA